MVVPSLILLAFALVMVPANLVLFTWVSDAADMLAQWFKGLTPPRVFLWLIVAAQVYGFTRWVAPGLLRMSSKVRVLPVPGDAWRANELRAALITFAGLNLLYLAVNLTDAAYLWWALRLPKGITFAEYAHGGSYRLIFAVVMAAVVTTVFYRVRARASETPLTMVLAYAFVAQNVIVLVGAARRLQLYVDAYGLTRFRISAFLWMVLVLVGFALILAKLARRLPFSFLVRANVASVVLLFTVVSLLDINGFIAGWNVGRYKRGMRRDFDVPYLYALGPTAMPALLDMARVDDADLSSQARYYLDRRLQQTRERHLDWQARTLRHARALRSVEPAYLLLPPVTDVERSRWQDFESMRYYD